jgi:Predicted amidophosphoribosyltransferases
MFCSCCGREIEADVRFCPYCGTNLTDFHIPDSEEKIKEEKEYHDEDINVREYDLEGVRRKGRFTFAHIYSKITVQNEIIEIVTNIDGADSKQYRFQKSDIEKIKFNRYPVKIGKGIIDALRIMLFIFMVPFTYGCSLAGVLFFINMMCCRNIILTLVNGKRVYIPICQDADSIPFLRELGYPEYNIKKLENKRISDSAWSIRELVMTIASLALAGSIIAVGIEMYQTNKNYLSEEEQKIEDIEDFHISDHDGYLSTENERISPSPYEEDKMITETPQKLDFKLTVVNNTGIDIYHLYASEADNDDWEEDILGDDILYTDESFDIIFTIGADDLEWDFAIKDVYDNQIDFYDMSFENCSVDGATLVLEYENGEGRASLY